MSPELAIDVCRRAIITILIVSAPMLLSGLIVGLLVSIFQAATQINEQTLSFIPKIVVVFLTMLIFGSWIIRILSTFSIGLFEMLATL